MTVLFTGFAPCVAADPAVRSSSGHTQGARLDAMSRPFGEQPATLRSPIAMGRHFHAVLGPAPASQTADGVRRLPWDPALPPQAAPASTTTDAGAPTADGVSQSPMDDVLPAAASASRPPANAELPPASSSSMEVDATTPPSKRQAVAGTPVDPSPGRRLSLFGLGGGPGISGAAEAFGAAGSAIPGPEVPSAAGGDSSASAASVVTLTSDLQKLFPELVPMAALPYLHRMGAPTGCVSVVSFSHSLILVALTRAPRGAGERVVDRVAAEAEPGAGTAAPFLSHAASGLLTRILHDNIDLLRRLRWLRARIDVEQVRESVRSPRGGTTAPNARRPKRTTALNKGCF